MPYPSNGRLSPNVGDKYSSYARKILGDAWRSGCDGVFVFSDEEIGLITMDLFRRGVIPSKLQVLTLNGVGDAMRHNPPISCLSHANQLVVRTVVEQLSRIARGDFISSIRIMIPPELYLNETLTLQCAPMVSKGTFE